MALAETAPPFICKWLDQLISFSGADQWCGYDHPGRLALLVSPIIKTSRIQKVLVDGGSSINLIFPRTLQSMGIHRNELQPSEGEFYRIMPRTGSLPQGHIYLKVTFGGEDNYRSENLRFEVPTSTAHTTPSWGDPP